MALAEKFGITKYPNPAGGCLLTDPGFAKRVRDAIAHNEFSLGNIAILSVGRHFRLSDKARLVVGRDANENSILLSLAKSDDTVFKLKDHQGPISILIGVTDVGLVEQAAGIAAYHTKFRDEESVAVNYWTGKDAAKETISVKAAKREAIENLRI